MPFRGIDWAEQTGNILQHSSVLLQLLTQWAPEVKYPQSKPKYSARLLTSSENLMLLEEKERKKKEEAEEKQKKGGKREKAIGTGGSEAQEKTGETVGERWESESETRSMFITERYASGGLKLWDDWCFTIALNNHRGVKADCEAWR